MGCTVVIELSMRVMHIALKINIKNCYLEYRQKGILPYESRYPSKHVW